MALDDLTYWVGTTFLFDGSAYTATSISVSRSTQEFDVTHCGIAVDTYQMYRASEVENCEMKVDWVGISVPQVTATGTISFTGLEAGFIGAKALATGLTLTASAGDLVRGSCTFKISYD